MAELHPRAKALKDAAGKLAPLYTLRVGEARARMRATFVGPKPPPVARVGDVEDRG